MLLRTFFFNAAFPRNRHAAKNFRLLFGSSEKTMQNSEVTAAVWVVCFSQLEPMSLADRSERQHSFSQSCRTFSFGTAQRGVQSIFCACHCCPVESPHKLIVSVQSAIAAGVAPKCEAAKQCVQMIATLREVEVCLILWYLVALHSSFAFS